MQGRILLTVALASVMVPSAHAAVTLIGITGVVHPGGSMSLSVRSGADRRVCSPRVHYRSRPPLVAAGLHPKGALFAGIVSWKWKMPATAARGVWSADVSCGAAGSLHTTFVVR